MDAVHRLNGGRPLLSLSLSEREREKKEGLRYSRSLQ